MKTLQQPLLKRFKRGFTLLELLAAVAIMSMMAIMILQSLDGMVRVIRNVQERQETIAVLNTGLLQWEKDLEMMVETPPLSILIWDGKALLLVRHNVASDSAAGFLLVAWTRSLHDGQGQWMRWQSQPLRTREQTLAALEQARIWSLNPSDALRANEVVILPVDDWQIYFYRRDAWSNPLSVDFPAGENQVTSFSTDSTGSSVPVDGVRLALTLPSGHPMAGVIIKDWVRPTLSHERN